jgi:predicted amidophosphoribosyltransferase
MNSLLSPHLFKTFIDALVPSRCAVCELPSLKNIICQSCSTTIETDESTFLYRGAIKILVQSAKFSRDETAAGQLIRHWSETVVLKRDHVDIVTFVPLHWRRRLWRRFDLAALFARAVAKKIDRPLVDLLSNTRYDKPLTLQLGKQAREEATRDRYTVRKKLNGTKNILLVDDVMTSGSTFRAASAPLIGLGHRVQTLSLAKSVMSLSSKGHSNFDF